MSIENKRRENQEQIAKEFNKLFNSDRIISNLTLAALYLSIFETMKLAIISNIESFFSTPHEIYDFTINKRFAKKSKEYRDRIKIYFLKDAKGRVIEDEYIACSQWLIDNGVIVQSEMQTLKDIRAHRNSIAHELPSILIDPKMEVDILLLEQAKQFIDVIDRWWLINVDIPCDPIYDSKQIEESEVFSGRMLCINHIVNCITKEIILPETSSIMS